jgi:hypothetical protein
MATEPPAESWEIEVDDEQFRVRKHRETFLLKAGFSEFAAFRLAMRFDIEKEKAASLLATSHDEQFVVDQLID